MTLTMPLDGLKILVVEDEFLVAMDLARMIEDLGGDVLGPASTLSSAKELLQTPELDGAVMDIKLGHESSLPLAEELLARGVPIVFTTGYGKETLPENLAHTPRLSKPYNKIGFRQVAVAHFARASSEKE